MVDEYFENVARHIILVFESCAGKNLLDVNRDATTRPDDRFISQKRFTVSEGVELASYLSVLSERWIYPTTAELLLGDENDSPTTITTEHGLQTKLTVPADTLVLQQFFSFSLK